MIAIYRNSTDGAPAALVDTAESTHDASLKLAALMAADPSASFFLDMDHQEPEE